MALLLLAGACKTAGPIKMEPTGLAYHPQDELIKFETPQKGWLELKPFKDGRPKGEIAGNQPRAYSMLLAKWQIGTFQTGDEVWNGKPEEGATVAEKVAAGQRQCFEKTNYFKSIRGAGDKAAPPDGKGFVLETEIESLRAERYVHSHNYNFLIAWSDKMKLGPVVGRCKLVYRLLDAESGLKIDEGALESEIRQQDDKNQIDVAQIGLKALHQAQTKLANKVTQLLLEY